MNNESEPHGLARSVSSADVTQAVVDQILRDLVRGSSTTIKDCDWYLIAHSTNVPFSHRAGASLGLSKSS
jgi:hypothetical protein